MYADTSKMITWYRPKIVRYLAIWHMTWLRPRGGCSTPAVIVLP